MRLKLKALEPLFEACHTAPDRTLPMKKKSDEKAWALLEGYVGNLA